MRIAFLLHQFPALSETFILRQIAGLVAMGHDVRIYAEYACEGAAQHPDVKKFNLLSRTTYLGVPSESGLYELPIRPVWGAVWPADTGQRVSNACRLWRSLPKVLKCLAHHPRLTREVLSTHYYGYQAASLSALYRLAALAEEETKFDILHAHFGPVGRSFRFTRRLWHAPLVVSFHGYDFSDWPLREGPQAYKSLFAEADLITVHSAYADQKLRSLGCPPRLLRRLESGIDVDEFSFRVRHPPTDRAIRLLTVGRLVEKKGIEFSIRAVAQLLREGFDLEYEIVGDGPLRNQLTQLAADVDGSGRITFAGPKDIGYVRDRMQECDLFILASITAKDGGTEGAPVSLLEAQACGMPVVSTYHAGIPEIVIDNESGYLVPERDVPTLADALRRLVTNGHRWAELGTRGRAIVEERHNLAPLNERLVHLYEEVLSPGGWRHAKRIGARHTNDRLFQLSE
jgi:colanic acid/amylovoran biosynthesis glycosyltransferase